MIIAVAWLLVAVRGAKRVAGTGVRSIRCLERYQRLNGDSVESYRSRLAYFRQTKNFIPMGWFGAAPGIVEEIASIPCAAGY